jgi:hypothetical protein
MVYPLTPYRSAPGDYRASTTRLLLAQADRWIESRLTPDCTGVIEVRIERVGDGLGSPMRAGVLLMPDTFGPLVAPSIAQGALYSRKMGVSLTRVALLWEALGVEAACYVPSGTRFPGEPRGAA